MSNDQQSQFGPYVFLGYDPRYGSANPPLSQASSPAALILQCGQGALSQVTITLSAFTPQNGENGVTLFSRSWPNGWPTQQGNLYLSQEWTGSELKVPTWNPIAGDGSKWVFSAGPTQAWSIIAQTESGLVAPNTPYTISLSQNSGQALNVPFTATFQNVDGKGGNISVTISVTSSTGGV